MVTLLLPASSVSSTHTSRENQPFASVVLFDHEKSGWIKPRGCALDHAVHGLHHHSFAESVAGTAIEHAQDGFLASADQHAAKTLDGRQQGDQHFFARLHLA